MNHLLPLAVLHEDWASVRAALPYAAFGLLVVFAACGLFWLCKERRGVRGVVVALWRWLTWSQPAATGDTPAAHDARGTPDERMQVDDPVLLAVIAAAASVCLDDGEHIVAIHPEGSAAEYTRHLWAWPAEGRRDLIDSRERLAIPEVPSNSCGRGADGWRSVEPAVSRD